MTNLEGFDAWRGLVEAVAESGDAVTALGRDAPDIDIAEGFHYVLDVLGHQVERSTMRASDRPQFLPGITRDPQALLRQSRHGL